MFLLCSGCCFTCTVTSVGLAFLSFLSSRLHSLLTALNACICITCDRLNCNWSFVKICVTCSWIGWVHRYSKLMQTWLIYFIFVCIGVKLITLPWTLTAYTSLHLLYHNHIFGVIFMIKFFLPVIIARLKNTITDTFTIYTASYLFFSESFHCPMFVGQLKKKSDFFLWFFSFFEKIMKNKNSKIMSST